MMISTDTDAVTTSVNNQTASSVSGSLGTGRGGLNNNNNNNNNNNINSMISTAIGPNSSQQQQDHQHYMASNSASSNATARNENDNHEASNLSAGSANELFDEYDQDVRLYLKKYAEVFALSDHTEMALIERLDTLRASIRDYECHLFAKLKAFRQRIQMFSRSIEGVEQRRDGDLSQTAPQRSSATAGSGSNNGISAAL